MQIQDVGPYLTHRGRQLQSYQLLPLFGLKRSSPIPPDFFAEKEINGTMVRIYKARGGRRKRVMAICSDCGKEVCAGHLHQHRKIHKEG